MKIHRFIINSDLTGEKMLVSEPDLVTQMRSVLKLKVGEQVILGDGSGNEVLGEISRMTKEGVEVSVLKTMKNENEPARHVTLYCALLKRENFELVVQKATEIGVKEIVPLITKRTVKLDIKKERLEKIIKEAAEQSGRGIVPVLRNPLDFEKAVEQVKDGESLFFDSSGSVVDPNTYNLKAINLFVGPEGGWDEEEVQKAKDKNFTIVSLGKLTLRGETAAIVASYMAIQGHG